MSPWKVILATLVIFSSGLAVGALLSKKSRPDPIPQPFQRGHTNTPAAWNLLQRELIRKLDRELDLTSEQRLRVEKILKESQERTKQIREKIAPELRDEVKNVREQIKAELTPEQQEKYEKSMKTKQRKPDESNDELRRKKDGFRRQQTNQLPTEPL